MCLGSKFTIKERTAWLKKQPDMITAYKVCHEASLPSHPLCLHSIFIDYTPYKRKNRLKKENNEKNRKTQWTFYAKAQRTVRYIAYYHLFYCKKASTIYIGV